MQDHTKPSPTTIRALSPLHLVTSHWAAMDRTRRAIVLVSLGSLTQVVMATLVKHLGTRIPALEIFFFRSLIGFFFVYSVFWRNPLEPFRTKRPGMHFVRGAVGALGNACFFWTLTHMLLADAMALQFSRPLFMIPLAIFFLGEVVGLQRIGVAVAGFAGILLYARPFTAGFEPGGFVGAFGALVGGLVVICIKRLQSTEPTRVIMFYYAFWNTLLAAIPAAIWWVTPNAYEFMVLIAVGFLGMAGQGMITHGLSQGDATVLIPLDYSRILYSAIVGYLLFAEIPSAWSFAGMAVIIACSLYLVLTEKKRKVREREAAASSD
jgi:drug/metabolite transporter (DMT)-like permease